VRGNVIRFPFTRNEDENRPKIHRHTLSWKKRKKNSRYLLTGWRVRSKKPSAFFKRIEKRKKKVRGGGERKIKPSK
jgi:hypothetical protein